MSRTIRLLLLWLSVWLVVLSPVVGGGAEPTNRPRVWATRIDRPGLPNLYKINDGLYRGAQPTPEGIGQLEKMGVKTIVALRAEYSDKQILGGANLALEQFPLSAWNIHEEDIVRFLRIVTDKNRQPVFVHCLHGADRTGTMCAAYRVVVDGWSKQQAIDEMTKGGYGFHPVWTNLPKLIENLDVDKVKAKAGLKKDGVARP
jgi:protein tyrosine/serine phosphatase